MTLLLFTLIVFLGSVLAGLLGSLTGLGGGVVIIPMLTLGFGVDIRYAIGASIVAVIATSSGAASAYVKEGFTNIRLGMFLEIATTLGAVGGAIAAVYAPTNAIAIIFGCILIASAFLSLRKKANHIEQTETRLSKFFKLGSSFPDKKGTKIFYTVRYVSGGFFMMVFAGLLSGLLGIGSGALKVLAMDNIMRVPFKVSTTTSNFMIGVTAAASAVIYFQRGYIDPGLCLPVTLGVLAGALAGSKILTRSETKNLRYVFAVVIFLLAFEMIYNGLTGRI